MTPNFFSRRQEGAQAASTRSSAPLKRSLTLLHNRRDLYRAKLVFYLFLVSLAMFFAAGLASYCIIRLQAFHPIKREYLPLSVPTSFWYSTLILILASVFLQRSVWLVRRERQIEFRNWLVFAWLAAIAFVIVQYSGMTFLFETHFTRDDGSSKAYGLCFILALLHVLHVLGGIVFLGFVIWQGYQNRYDHERHYPVEHCASYWHFLGGVWMMMLLTFVITG